MSMNINYVRKDGTPVSSQLRTFLQSKHEVIKVEHVSSTVVVR